MALGDKDKALRWLERSYQDRAGLTLSASKSTHCSIHCTTSRVSSARPEGFCPGRGGSGESGFTVNLRNSFNELKRRNVYKVAIAYAVIAWLLFQAGSILFPTFEAPGGDESLCRDHRRWVSDRAGFGMGLRADAGGNQRTEEVSPHETMTLRTGRKIDFVIIGVLLWSLRSFSTTDIGREKLRPPLSRCRRVSLFSRLRI